MKPYGTENGEKLLAADRLIVNRDRFRKIPMDEWKAIKRNPKKRARRESKEEIARELQHDES